MIKETPCAFRVQAVVYTPILFKFRRKNNVWKNKFQPQQAHFRRSRTACDPEMRQRIVQQTINIIGNSFCIESTAIEFCHRGFRLLPIGSWQPCVQIGLFWGTKTHGRPAYRWETASKLEKIDGWLWKAVRSESVGFCASGNYRKNMFRLTA